MRAPEGNPLPSPQCRLADPEDIRSAISGIYHGMVEASAKPMLRHGRHDSYSVTNWRIHTNDFEMRIEKKGSFDNPQGTESLSEGNFNVIMKGPDDKLASFDVRYEQGTGSLAFFNTSELISPSKHLSPEAATLGQASVRAFLDGAPCDQVSKTTRRVATFRTPSDESLRVTETRDWQNGELTEATAELSIARSSSAGGFLLEATLQGTEVTVKRYRDTRDYLGPFGIHPDHLDLLSVPMGRLEFWVPSTLRTRTPHRTALERAIENTSYTLTVGRLREVHAVGASALYQLGQYHQEYLNR